MKRIYIILTFLAAVSCSTNEEISVVDTDINFMPVEVYNNWNLSEIPSLKLLLTTLKNYPCSNYSIITEQTIDNDELIIRFQEIYAPGNCLTSIGPARSYIDLPENIHEVIFINGNETDKYSIEVGQEKIFIQPVENSFTHTLYNNTFRYPENSFAYVCGTNTDNTEVYEEFLNILKQNENFTEFEFQGEGRIPYPDSSSGHWVNHPSKFFKYSDYDEYKNIKGLLENFTSENIEENSGVTISIYGWDNISFHSWLNN
nr:hypothetical protein [Christiangramia fulva]